MSAKPQQAQTTSSEKPAGTSSNTSDPLESLKKGADSLIKRAVKVGENKGKKDAKSPQAKKGYQIIDAVVRLDDEKRKANTTDAKLRGALRKGEDNPNDIKAMEAIVRIAFTKMAVLSDSSDSEEISEDTD